MDVDPHVKTRSEESPLLLKSLGRTAEAPGVLPPYLAEASSATGEEAGVPVAASTVPQTAKRSKPSEKETRVAAQPGFVLHSYPYKETSLIVDLFSRDYGRVALIAKGAKRPHSRLRGVLQTFQPLSVSWAGKSEVRTLTSAEWIGGLLPLEKSALLCGFYLNELLVRLLARDDPHPALFDHYVSTLNQLAHDEPAPIVLRKFERALLKETGVGGNLTLCTSTGNTVEMNRIYVVDPERGPRHAVPADTWPRVSGKTLLDVESEDYSDSVTQTQSKFLMRFLLGHYLGGAPLNTRQILIDLMQL
ncbi:DNA repair protein RecO [Noviherbaspirillum massiliense]|uniref:DNA repair protein RecO n=1 Tax=Noviherbaspirillum massiliense TaxID=1465823 RepID=UPI00036A01D7